MTLEEVNDFMNMINEIDVSTFSILDQSKIMAAYATMAETIKPVYIKNMAKDKNMQFICRL